MESTFCKISLVCTAIVVFKIFKALYNNLFVRFLNSNQIDWNTLGKWALVTGSTDGIGKAYSEALAGKGFNMILISRTESKLDTIAKDIKDKYSVEVKTIAADFTREDIYDDIQAQLGDLEVGVLVNNVGMSYDYPENFLDIPNHSDFVKNLINCNVLSVMKMCKMVMPGMVQKKKGVVINIASTAALIPNPMLTIYSSTKAAVTKFTSDLAAEYEKDGLIIQAVCPGYVATKMSKIRKSSLLAPFPKEFVDSALRTVGQAEITTGYLPHTLFNAIIHMIEGCSEKLCRYVVITSMTKVRKGALKRASKKK